MLPANSYIHFKVALKVPNYMKTLPIRGEIQVSVKKEEGLITNPIVSLNRVPVLKCMKLLDCPSVGQKVIRLIWKKNMKQ